MDCQAVAPHCLVVGLSGETGTFLSFASLLIPYYCTLWCYPILKEEDLTLDKPIRLVIAFGLLSMLTACAGMVDSMDKMIGVGQISVEKETLDDSTTVKVTPAFLTDDVSDHGMNSYKLGGRWNSQAPNTIFLEPNFESQVGGNTYTGFDGITVRINGNAQRFDRVGRTNLSSSDYNTVSNTIYTESSGVVPVPLSTVENMLNSDDVRLRIHSSDGYEDSIFSADRADNGQKLARPYFQDFLAEIEKQKRQ